MTYRAIVTGATRGLGRGIARGLASKGATVGVTGRDTDALAEVCAEIEAQGGKALALICDHRDDEQVAAAFAQVKRDLGGACARSSLSQCSRACRRW